MDLIVCYCSRLRDQLHLSYIALTYLSTKTKFASIFLHAKQ